MKKQKAFRLFVILLLTNNYIFAQWSTNTVSNTIYPNDLNANVGIGTSVATSKLTVLGFDIALFNNGNNTAIKGYSSPSAVGSSTFSLLSNSSSIDGPYLQMTAKDISFPWSNGSLTLCSNGVDGNGVIFGNFNPVTQTWAATPSMVIKKTGQIGIGTEWPDFNYKLDVCGKIRCKELKVETGWCDYVFKPDYNLMPLEQLQVFLKEKYHLPEIPTEEDVVKNGSNIGNMQMLQMKKIEELTLYILQLHERIKKLEHRIGILNN
jgi:hypothetical protein